MENLPEIESRSDMLLHNIADGTPSIDDLEPQSRMETYLKYIAQNGGEVEVPLPVNKGGTGATTAAAALTNLGAQAASDNSLLTNSKTIVGAINEIYGVVGTANENLEGVLIGGE